MFHVTTDMGPPRKNVTSADCQYIFNKERQNLSFIKRVHSISMSVINIYYLHIANWPSGPKSQLMIVVHVEQSTGPVDSI
jgi:hypothetical protein